MENNRFQPVWDYRQSCFYLEIPSVKGHFLGGSGCFNFPKSLVTAGDLGSYGVVTQKALSCNGQYLEIGAGLGELVSHLIKNSRGKIGKPIVVDEAPYEIMRDALEFMLKSKLDFWTTKKRLRELLGRCETILDESKVRLINENIYIAARRPELQDVADLVVDVMGPYHYSGRHPETNLVAKNLIEVERTFLKNSGELFVLATDCEFMGRSFSKSENLVCAE